MNFVYGLLVGVLIGFIFVLIDLQVGFFTTTIYSKKTIVQEIAEKVEEVFSLSRLVGDKVYDTKTAEKLCDINRPKSGKEDSGFYTTNSGKGEFNYELDSLWAQGQDLFYVVNFTRQIKSKEGKLLDNEFVKKFIYPADVKKGLMHLVYNGIEDASLALYIRQTYVDLMPDDPVKDKGVYKLSFTFTLSEDDTEEDKQLYEVLKKANELKAEGKKEESQALFDSIVCVVKPNEKENKEDG